MLTGRSGLVGRVEELEKWRENYLVSGRKATCYGHEEGLSHSEAHKKLDEEVSVMKSSLRRLNNGSRMTTLVVTQALTLLGVILTALIQAGVFHK